MTIVALALVGGVLGAVLLNGGFSGFWAGAAIGALAAWIMRLSSRVQELERRASEVDAHGRVPEVSAPSPSRPEAEAAARASVKRVAQEPPFPPTPTPAPAPAPSTAGATPVPDTIASNRTAIDASADAGPPRPPGPIERAFNLIREWFTTGNVPVKVGVVLSVFGVGFLVKEVVDRNWMIIPIELRLAFVALFGIGLLALGWRLRDRHRSYALSVQGGGVAVLYLTIYASFALYGLLPAVAAFLMLFVVTMAVGALAVLQNSRALAVLGVIGGFMAPVLTSSGSGNHVMLFGYYAMLNVAIVGVAWFKAWRMLNVLGFIFTFGIASLWGYDAYRPEHFATTEPFLVLFVLMYTFIPVLFATRQAPDLKGFVDGTLLFGTPIVGFGLQTQLVGDFEYGLAISAIALAALYVGLATVLFRRRAADLQVLIEALFALSIVFLTIAVPLALDTRWTSVAWALQGAAMIWLGIRQQRKLALASGVALQLAAGAAHFTGEYFGFRYTALDMPVLNGAFLGAALLSAAGGLSGWLCDRNPMLETRRMAFRLIAPGFLVWGTAWWLLAGLVEIERHVPSDFELMASLLFVAATALAAVLAAPRVAWPRLNLVGPLTLPAIALGALASLLSQSHPLDHYGWLSWAAIFAAHWLILRMREAQFTGLRTALHAIAYWALAMLLFVEVAWLVGRVAGGVWPETAALAAVAVLVLFTVRMSATPMWPVGTLRRTYLLGSVSAPLALLAFATVNYNLTSPGDPAPLPYVPLLNPLELTSVFVLLVLHAWWRAVQAMRSRQSDGESSTETQRLLDPRIVVAIPALFGLFLLTMIVARTVHHWTGVPFELDLLASSTQLQAALSIVWGTTALGAMLIGARSARRAVWLAGAVLMTVVVAKLFLVELGNAGTVGRVVSFLGVGVLLLVVGYFAPVPPRAELAQGRA